MNNFWLFVFVFCWIFIGGVGAIDACLTVLLQEHLCDLEQNPIARMILINDGWNVSKFIGMKMFGTILVLGILICLFKKDTRYGLVVVSALALFQASLLMYLLL